MLTTVHDCLTINRVPILGPMALLYRVRFMKNFQYHKSFEKNGFKSSNERGAQKTWISRLLMNHTFGYN